MTTLGLIGAGKIGSTLARLAIAAGHDVVLSNSRGPETLVDLITDLGPRARAATPADVAAETEIVVVTIPLRSIDQLPLAALAGKTVIDTNNYYPARDGAIPALDAGETTTSQLLQDLIPDADVVKAFSNIYFLHLAALPTPAGSTERSALPVAGNSAAARAAVGSLLDGLGYDAVEVGALTESWRFERDRPAYCLPYAADPEALRTGGPGASLAQPASASKLRALLDDPGPRIL